ncbi:cation-translocating P-type ATPase [Almyronema epifaneia]|uniref:Cation-translocating P-type ATPase n=1 Tax=Almyronema epifaneia S1 TaxID=2991925 RepID=A0ABW6IB10_9CYAN
MGDSRDRSVIGSQSVDDALKTYAVEPERGLDPAEAKKRYQKHGPNQLQTAPRRSSWEIFVTQFKSPIIALLAIAAVLSFAFQEWIEGIAILIAIGLNAGIGFFTEVKAVRSMESLKQLSKSQAQVRRAGEVQVISAEDIVPGDIVVLEGGDLVSADLRLIKASKLQVDESPLTGESLPVSKTTAAIAAERPLAEQENMLFKGTAVTRGTGEGVAVATGMDTELGKISSLTAEAEDQVTPLEKRLDELGRRLIWITLAIAVVVAISGILGGKDLVLMVETAIALSVAAVPEGLPIVATVALARGMWRMAKRNALINKLSAVETLGATSIICTDKTGTLTENRMTVTQVALATGSVEVTGDALEQSGEFLQSGNPLEATQNNALRQLLKVAVLCNNASLPKPEQAEDELIGDPMEIALLVLSAKANIRPEQQQQDYPEVREIAFDSESKMMATVHEAEKGYRFAVKGAPEAVLKACSHQLTDEGIQPLAASERQFWQDQCTQMAEQGLRILALATKTADQAEVEPYRDLTLLGVVGLEDPPRQDVGNALKACHQAGIRVIMVTGDQVITARNIGVAVGLVGQQEAQAREGKALRPLEDMSSEEQTQLEQVQIFARVSPEQKLNLISLHQAHGDIVAMTGDGVNDAPALKKADIGIAMGRRGTQVAQEAAAMVLQDDAFSSIVAAVAQGRAIFRNIRQFTFYLLSGNVGEILAVAIASLAGLPLPLLPLQILYLNAVNDVFPALALGVGEGNETMMQRPPRKADEPVLTWRHWTNIGGYGLIIAAAVLAAFLAARWWLGLDESQAVTTSFLTLAFGRLWHVFNMRTPGTGIVQNEVVSNPYVWGSLLVCTGLLLSAVYLPGLSPALQTVHPTWPGWGLVLGMSLIPLVLGQIWQTLQSPRVNS